MDALVVCSDMTPIYLRPAGAITQQEPIKKESITGHFTIRKITDQKKMSIHSLMNNKQQKTEGNGCDSCERPLLLHRNCNLFFSSSSAASSLFSFLRWRACKECGFAAHELCCFFGMRVLQWWWWCFPRIRTVWASISVVVMYDWI